MSIPTRPVKIKLRSDGGSAYQTVHFLPEMNGGDGEVLLEKYYTVATDADGEATKNLPVGRWTALLPAQTGVTEKVFDLVYGDGSEIDLDELILAGAPDTPQPVYDYIDEQFANISGGTPSSDFEDSISGGTP
jgi:hypothetical protein